MTVYLVRNFETKTLLGLYWHSDLESLWWEVDGAADPANYEYAKIEYGALYFGGVEPTIDQTSDGWTEKEAEDFTPATIPWNEASPSEKLWEALHCSRNLHWTRFPFSDEPGGGVHELLKVAQQKRTAL